MNTNIPAKPELEACIPRILTINGGSSSIKFALFRDGYPPTRILYGKIDRIDQGETSLEFCDVHTQQKGRIPLKAQSYSCATKCLIEWLDEQMESSAVTAIGHRVVHGMERTAPELVTPELLVHLRRISSCDPQHLPCEIDLIEAFQTFLPNRPQYACFDTGFHAGMPRVAKLIALPRKFDRRGLQRYGFHGISYAYLMQELLRLGDPAATFGKVLLAHLGNGCSLAAIRDGKCIDTSMGFTPASGLIMSTRSGDLDPGLAGFLARTESLSLMDFDHMVNFESGLLGVSEQSGDMRDLLNKEPYDVRAAEAVELFCYQAKKWIGMFFAALGGLQTLVFSGGIGENASSVRARICDGLSCLGIELDPTRNIENSPVISNAQSLVVVRVVPTDEEQMIAQWVIRLLGGKHV